jgi:hypothetical protein
MQVTLSVRPLPGFSKSEREDIKFYTRYLKCYFESLVELLSKDYMYSPFGYLGMEQGLYNICSEAQFIVIDVDYTSTDIHSRLLQLADEELECILGTTSDPSNLLKYRVLLPLNRPVNSKEYRRLVTGVREFGLIPDLDRASERPSQKFYSYANSTVVFNKGSPLVVDNYLAEESQVSQTQLNCDLELHHILDELSSYSTAPPGSRTRYLLSAAFNLVERGADNKLIEQVILHINRSFLVPKDTNSVYRRVINFIKTRRKFL